MTHDAEEATDPADPSEDHIESGEAAEGVVVEERRLTTRTHTGQLQPRQRAGLPAPVKKAAVALAAGAAIQVGVGLAGKWLAYRAGKTAAEGIGTKALRARGNGKRAHKPEKSEDKPSQPFDDVAAVTETLIVRRTWYRRER